MNEQQHELLLNNIVAVGGYDERDMTHALEDIIAEIRTVEDDPLDTLTAYNFKVVINDYFKNFELSSDIKVNLYRIANPMDYERDIDNIYNKTIKMLREYVITDPYTINKYEGNISTLEDKEIAEERETEESNKLERFKVLELTIVHIINDCMEDANINLNYEMDLKAEINYIQGNLNACRMFIDGERLTFDNKLYWSLARKYARLRALCDKIEKELTSRDLKERNLLEIYRLYTCYTGQRLLNWEYVGRGKTSATTIAYLWESGRE